MYSSYPSTSEDFPLYHAQFGKYGSSFSQFGPLNSLIVLLHSVSIQPQVKKGVVKL